MEPTTKTRAERGAVKVQVSLKAIMLVVSQTLEGTQNLEEDLERIGCAGLLNKPWNLKDEDLVPVLLLGVSNQVDFTVRGKLK